MHKLSNLIVGTRWRIKTSNNLKKIDKFARAVATNILMLWSLKEREKGQEPWLVPLGLSCRTYAVKWRQKRHQVPDWEAHAVLNFFFPWKINESCSCLLQVLIWVLTSMCRKMTLPQKSTSNAAKVVKGKGLLKRMQENKWRTLPEQRNIIAKSSAQRGPQQTREYSLLLQEQQDKPW